MTKETITRILQFLFQVFYFEENGTENIVNRMKPIKREVNKKISKKAFLASLNESNFITR